MTDIDALIERLKRRRDIIGPDTDCAGAAAALERMRDELKIERASFLREEQLRIETQKALRDATEITYLADRNCNRMAEHRDAAEAALERMRDQENAEWVKANDRAVAAEAEVARLRGALREILNSDMAMREEDEGQQSDVLDKARAALASTGEAQDDD